jgi:hypothetical protein
MLLPEAAIRIVQCSAGAVSTGGNGILSNRRQQQQRRQIRIAYRVLRIAYCVKRVTRVEKYQAEVTK